MMQKRKIEDYVKTIYELKRKGTVRGAYIAQVLSVSKPTVSVTLKMLQQEGYVNIHTDHSVTLTQRGTKIAKQVLERNHIFYDLLVRLGVDSDTAMQDACKMEHALSQKSFDALLLLTEKWLDDP